MGGEGVGEGGGEVQVACQPINAHRPCCALAHHQLLNAHRPQPLPPPTRSGAGTDSNVFIELHGDKGSVGQTRLETSANNFERGMVR